MKKRENPILEELVLIRKELQAIRKALESDNNIFMVREPYSSRYSVVGTVSGLDGSFGASEGLKRYPDTADKRMGTGGDKERTEWRRFESLTETEAERERLERVLDEHQLFRQDLAIILSGLRIRPEFGKEHFGI